LPGTTLRSLTVSQFSREGIAADNGTTGTDAGRIKIEGITFRPADAQAVSLHLVNSSLIDVVRCRFFGAPGSTGIDVAGGAHDLSISECVFFEVASGIRLPGDSKLKGVQIAKNSFGKVAAGIEFISPPGENVENIWLMNNLFTQVELEAVIRGASDLADPQKEVFDRIAANLNQSDRSSPAKLSKGEVDIFSAPKRYNPRGMLIEFESADPESKSFLTPKGGWTPGG
jgi:hypothetical protein